MRNLIEKIWPVDNSIEVLLDLGCGNAWFTERLPGVKRHIGVDLHQPSIDRAIAKNIPGFQPYCTDLRQYIRTQPDGYFDCVMAIDVIEHFNEDEAKYLITQIDRVAKTLVIIWTTMGYIEQGPYSNDGEYNEYQKHLSAPTLDWFPDKEGWKVDSYPEWHGVRGGAYFAYKFINKKPPFQLMNPINYPNINL